MNERISSKSSPFECLLGFSFCLEVSANLIRAIKLFLQPKNMIGKAKKIEMRKLPLRRKKKGLEKVEYSKDSKKFAWTP
jgi:hypothetical protein